jgi:hypothetical protein
MGRRETDRNYRLEYNSKQGYLERRARALNVVKEIQKMPKGSVVDLKRVIQKAGFRHVVFNSLCREELYKVMQDRQYKGGTAQCNMCGEHKPVELDFYPHKPNTCKKCYVAAYGAKRSLPAEAFLVGDYVHQSFTYEFVPR